MHRLRLVFALSLALALLPPLPAALPAQAATRVVTSLADTNAPGTLRREVADAAAGDTITFRSGLAGTITLGGTQIALTKDVTIQGPGAASLTISGNMASRVFSVAATRTVRISGVRIANGRPTGGGGRGGGIENEGNLTLADSVVAANAAPTGGGIASTGPLTATNTTFADNTARNGGGLAAADATLTNCTFSGNTALDDDGTPFTGIGGGVWNRGTLTVAGGSFTGNAAVRGGGIYNDNGLRPLGASPSFAPAGGSTGTVTLTGVTIDRNYGWDGAGVFSTDALTLRDTTVSNNFATGGTGNGRSGGGIYSTGMLNMAGGAITGNTAVGNSPTYGGGGLLNGPGGTATLAGVAVGENTSDGDGGGIRNEGGLTITGGTVRGNRADNGGGIHNLAPGSLTVSGVRVTDNRATQDAGGGIISALNAVLILRDSTVSGNTTPNAGGGVVNNGTATITGSTISGNTAGGGGGGLAHFGTVATATVANSTISGNTVTNGPGGGIYIAEAGAGSGTVINTLTLRSVTVAANRATATGGLGGGIHQFGATVNIGNTIVAANTAGASGSRDYNLSAGTRTNRGYNVVLASNATWNAPGDIGPDLFPGPRLGPLADNGGPTQTHLLRTDGLMPRSVAIDAGSDAMCAEASVGNRDQRGVSRPRGPRCDIGALEMLVAAPTLAPTAYLVGTSGGQVTLRGTRFESVTAVTVGGAAVPVLAVAPDGTTLTIPIPARADGTMLQVVVTNPGAGSATGMLTYRTPDPAPTPPRPPGSAIETPPAPVPPPRQTPGAMIGGSNRPTPMPAPPRR